MYIDVLLGLQWGDEGKGKVVDYIADQYDIVARFQGGPNAGHTIRINENKYVLHTIPSGVFRPNILNLIGSGVVIDPITFEKELITLDKEGIAYRDRLLISRKAHLILPSHRWLDAASEASKGKEKIGSTLKGIGPTYMDKTPEHIGLDAQEAKLYRLIWERTIASQMKEAEVETTTYHFQPTGHDEDWIVKGEVIKFPGFMKLYIEGTDDEQDEESESKKLPIVKE